MHWILKNLAADRKPRTTVIHMVVINHIVLLQKKSTFIANNKGVFLAFILLTSFWVNSCSSSRHVIPEQGLLVGIIYRIGNDPFTKFGLQTSEGTVYILHCSKEIESKLMTKQGKSLQVHYSGRNQSPEGFILRVVKIVSPP
jgi:hypothetical protein